jgi:cytoskeleton protein RodZ
MPDSAAAAGERLRQARAAAGLEIADVTAELHLSETVIVALEAGDFESLGAPVFVRGHLRGYARLLKLPEAEIASACPDDLPDTAEFGKPLRPDLGPGFSIVNAALLAGLVLVMLIALIYWLAGDDDSADPAAPDAAAMHAPAEAPAVSPRARSGGSGNNTARPVIPSDRHA